MKKHVLTVLLSIILLFGLFPAQAETILERITALETAVGLSSEDATLEGRLRYMETQLGASPADGATFEQRIAALEAILGIAPQTGTGGKPAEDAGPSALTVDPIPENAVRYPAYETVEYQADEAEFLTFTDRIANSGDENTYHFLAEEAGVYRCEASDLVSGFTISMYLFNEKGERVDYSIGLRNGEGLTVSLRKGQRYTLQVKGYSGSGNYTVFIGMQKPAVDLSPYTVVYDATEFKGQEILYDYTPEVDGVHRFSIAKVNSGISFSLYVFDDAGYRVDYSIGIARNEGLNVTLEAGRTYRVVLKQYSSLGSYTMAVGPQQPTREITGYTGVTDSIQYKGQPNNYHYTPQVTGTHRFELGQVDSGFSVSMYLYDSAGYRIDYGIGLRRGEGLTVQLEAGETYLFRILQYSGYGEYPFSIGAKKPVVDISGSGAVRDSIQYKDQINSYTFTPSEDWTYIFEFDGIENQSTFSLYVYDDAGYRVDYSIGMRQGNKLSVALKKNLKYKIQVRQSSGLGTYILKRTKRK